MPITRNIVDQSKFNPDPVLPYELRIMDFEAAMQDVYDFFYDVNSHLAEKGWNVLTICCDQRLCPVFCRTW